MGKAQARFADVGCGGERKKRTRNESRFLLKERVLVALAELAWLEFNKINMK